MMTGNRQESDEKVFKTACCCHCGGACFLQVHVKNGLITRIETDDGEEPQVRACLRCRAYRQRIYAPDRVKYPLKRVGERGEGKFERISWDEALETTARELTRVRKVYGPSALVLLFSGGDIGFLQGGELTSNLLARTGGYTATWGWHSNGGTKYAAGATFGTLYCSNTRDSFLDSRLIILWGWNPNITITHTNTSWYLMQAKEKGIRIISVDPRYTSTAAGCAQQWIPIRPGTDAAMLVSMAYVMITENIYDKEFIDKYTIGFAQFKDYVLGKEDNVPKTPAWAEAITGVSATVIRNLALEYANTKPAALIAGIAPGRTAFGEQFHRVAITLSAMTGNIGIRGGDSPGVYGGGFGPTYELGASYGSTVGGRLKGGKNIVDRAPMRKNALPVSEKFYKGWNSSNRVNRFLLPDAILKGKAGGYPADYKMMYIVNASFMNQYPNTNKVVQALKKLEFVVVQEQFMSPTARYADIVLPTNTFLERNDVTVGGATPFYGYMNKVIDSLYESKSHFEIAIELAKKLGLSDYTDKTEEDWLKEVVQGAEEITDYDKFKKDGIHKVKLEKPRISFEKQIEDPANNPFPTPSGKIEIYSQQLADMNSPEIPPIPKYIETWESCNDPLAKKYPLQLITTHFKRRAHSTFETLPWLRELEQEPQAIYMNTADAQARGIKDGEEVRIFNDRGQMIIPAKVIERIMPGVVDIPEGAWYQPDENGVDRGGCCNILLRDEISPGEAMVSNTCLVQVEKNKV